MFVLIDIILTRDQNSHCFSKHLRTPSVNLQTASIMVLACLGHRTNFRSEIPVISQFHFCIIMLHAAVLRFVFYKKQKKT